MPTVRQARLVEDPPEAVVKAGRHQAVFPIRCARRSSHDSRRRLQTRQVDLHTGSSRAAPALASVVLEPYSVLVPYCTR